MWTYVAKRLLALLPILFGISVLVFGALYIIPGDAVESMMAETGASAEDMARLRSQLGLDQPFHIQYGRWLSNMLRGDFGTSLITGRTVTRQIGDQIPATIELTLASLTIALIIGVPLGILAALKRNSLIDTFSMWFALIGVSMPNFWLGLLLILVFSLHLRLLPASGTGGLRHLILPAFTLGFSGAAIIARVTRSSLLEILADDYIRTARSKGLRERSIVIKHGMRNALISVVTIAGLQVGFMLSGSVVIEVVFGRQGLGFLTANAIQRGDFPLVQGTVLISALVFVLANLLVDLSYALFDPRISYS